VARFFEPLTDALPRPGWDAARLRHVAQRNISVIEAASPAKAVIPFRLGCNAGPGPARVIINRVPADSVVWLSLLFENHDRRPTDAKSIRETLGLLPVNLVNDPRSRIPVDIDRVNDVAGLLRSSINIERQCDELETQLVIHIDGLEPGECAVYQIIQRTAERILGGYTVVAHRSKQ
jgi:hypothetical protein